MVSSWHSAVVASGATSDPDDERSRAEILSTNLADLHRADVVIALCDDGTPRATFCEIGFALAIGKRVVWVHGERGEGRNSYDAHPLVARVRAGHLPLAVRLKRAMQLLAIGANVPAVEDEPEPTREVTTPADEVFGGGTGGES